MEGPKLTWLSQYKGTCAAILTFLGLNLLAIRLDLPSYGTWTGIRPLEEKLRKLEDFARHGEVDAMVLGPSIADFGFSAELYSKLMSEKLGRPYRAFNFSTGAAELSFIPTLYKLAHTVSKPKAIFVVAPVQIKQDEVLSAVYPDYILGHSPIGSYLDNNFLLQLSKLIWSMPIPSKSAAMRDLMLFGRYKNLVGQGMDTYDISEYGDRLSYSAGMVGLEVMAKERGEHQGNVKPLPPSNDFQSFGARTAYFANIAIKAMDSVRNMSAENGQKIYLVAHASSTVLSDVPISNPDYLIGRAHYFDVLAGMLGSPLLNPLDDMRLPDYALMDASHLNIYGAEMFTEAVFQIGEGAVGLVKSPEDHIEAISLEPIRAKSPTFNTWSAVILREKDTRYRSLRCRFVNNFAVPALPVSDLYFALRMPDGSDVIAPANKLATGEYEARLDLPPSVTRQVLIFRLLYGERKDPLSAPMAGYTWSKG